MIFGSLFAGIGGFDLGLERAGFRSAFQVEIDDQAASILARHWPDVERHADVRDFGSATTAFRPGLLCGGFPCQDLSLAGKRAGLAGARSGLFFDFVRVARELCPRWLLLENVPGLLSDAGGRSMAIVLDALGQLGYGYAYRVFDAQWFGVAQQRKRVFIVGHRGNGRRAAEVLFESDSLPWDRRPRQQCGTDIAYCLTRGTGKPGRRGQDTFVLAQNQRGEVRTSDIAYTLSASPGTNQQSYVFQPRSHLIAEDGIRRLTPLECERLQGFPDDWTRYAASNAPLSDTARYRMLGNAVAVPVAEWIAHRINQVESQCESA